MATTQTSTAAITSKPPPTPAQPQLRIRPYKDFLTPALHRRFVRATFLVFAICYIQSILFRPPSLLWFWNPISVTGIRALLLFMPCLAIYIVRVANMHFGQLVTASPIESVWRTVVGFKGVHTLAWYVYSAFFFGEVYIWSRDEEAGLGWIDYGREDEWALLNENPIFLRALFFVIAVAQTVVHLNRGDDRLPTPKEDMTPATPSNSSKIPRSVQELQTRLPEIALRTVRLVIPSIAFLLPTYFLLLRPLLWPYYYAVGKAFLNNALAYQSRPTGLLHVGRLGWQCLTSSALLTLLWELSNAVFTIHVGRPPLTKGEDEPLTGLVATSEKSRDPNGSLISGLKNNKEAPRSFAFWELTLICTQFEVRRKTIYTEVDRMGGSTWAQISQVCLDEISTIQARIKAATTPSTPPQQPQPQPEPQGLPKIADRSVQAGDVWAKPMKSDYSHTVGNMAKSIGQSPGASNPVVPRARKAIEWSADRVLSKEEQARILNHRHGHSVGGAMVNFLRTPLGEPFRQTFARRVKCVMFGGGEGEFSKEMTITLASRALSTLCARSLKEDDFGQVAKSIATIIRTYVDTIKAVQGFVTSLPPSWTDVEFAEQHRNIKEVEIIVGVLKRGLEEVVLAFGEYASAIGLSKKELREAREMLGKGPEMASVR